MTALHAPCMSLVGDEDQIVWTDWPGEVPRTMPIWEHSREGPAKVHRLAGLFRVARNRRYKNYSYSVLWQDAAQDEPVLWQARCSLVPNVQPLLLLAMSPLPLGLLECSPQEMRVLACLGEGKSPKEVAREIGTSVPTVHTYLGRLRNKLDCEDLLGLVALAGKARVGELLRPECERIW